jgi:hypothetical protein
MFTVLLIILLIFFPFYDDKISSILSLVITILVSLLSAVLIVYFTLFKNQFFERRSLLEALYEEIIENKEKLVTINAECDGLREKWKKGDVPRWLPKQPQTGLRSKFFWRFLSLNIYHILIQRDYHIEIEGFRSSGMFTILGNYYSNSHDFCDELQIFELEGNLYANLIKLMTSLNIDRFQDYVYIYNNGHAFEKTNQPHIYTRKECEDKIDQIIDQMKGKSMRYLSSYNRDYSHIINNSKESFHQRQLKPNF